MAILLGHASDGRLSRGRARCYNGSCMPRLTERPTDPSRRPIAMRLHRLLVGLVVASACGPGVGAGLARGHFLFIRFGPDAGGGRQAQVYFSEQAEAGAPRFVPKVAHTQLWAQASPGTFQALTVR